MQPLIYRAGERDALGIDHITVNGRRVDMVFMACPRRGVVDAYRIGRDGKAKLDKRRKRLLTQRHRGAVCVVFRDGCVDTGGGRGHP